LTSEELSEAVQDCEENLLAASLPKALGNDSINKAHFSYVLYDSSMHYLKINSCALDCNAAVESSSLYLFCKHPICKLTSQQQTLTLNTVYQTPQEATVPHRKRT